MSSNIRIKRICKHCGDEFEARTTVTQCCSPRCGKAFYKARQRGEVIDRAIKKVEAVRSQSLQELTTKPYLSIKEACLLLGVKRITIYRMIKSQKLNSTKIGSRVIILKQSLDQLFEQNPVEMVPAKIHSNKELPDWDKIKMGEAQKLFGISEKALYELISRNNIPKYKEGKYALISISEFENILRK